MATASFVKAPGGLVDPDGMEDPEISPNPDSLAPSRDDTWRSLPDAQGDPTPPSADPDPDAEPELRPPSESPSPLGRLARTALTVGLVVVMIALRASVFGSGSDGDSPSPGPPPEPLAGLPGSSAEVRTYLSQVQLICQTHDLEIAAHPGFIPVEKIVRQETAVTGEIAAVRAPPEATEMRREMLAARRRVDEIAIPYLSAPVEES